MPTASFTEHTVYSWLHSDYYYHPSPIGCLVIEPLPWPHEIQGVILPNKLKGGTANIVNQTFVVSQINYRAKLLKGNLHHSISHYKKVNRQATRLLIGSKHHLLTYWHLNMPATPTAFSNVRVLKLQLFQTYPNTVTKSGTRLNPQMTKETCNLEALTIGFLFSPVQLLTVGRLLFSIT